MGAITTGQERKLSPEKGRPPTVTSAAHPPPALPLKRIERERDRCPACNSVRLKVQHSLAAERDDELGIITRHMRCETCRHTFVLVLK